MSARKNRTKLKWIIALAAMLFALTVPAAYTERNDNLALSVSIPTTFKEAVQGNFVMVIIDVYSFSSKGTEDVSMRCTIRDSAGNIISSKTKTVAVGTHLSELEKIEVKDSQAPGDYILEVEASLPGKEPVKASDGFTVVAKAGEMFIDYGKYIKYLIICISLLVACVLYLIYKLIKIEEKRAKHA